MKKCSRCKIEKPGKDFNNDKSKRDGLSSMCVFCVRENVRKWRKNNPEKRAEANKRYHKKHPEKSLLSSRKWRGNNPEKLKAMRKIIWKNADKQKIYAAQKEWRLANPDKWKEYWKCRYSKEEFREKHRDRARKWAAENKEKFKLRVELWRKSNPGRVRANAINRTLTKIKAIPKWANLRRIKSVYLACAAKPGFHVDHIIPLRNKQVCGLHVENNLRIITAIENLYKNNKLLSEFSNQ